MREVSGIIKVADNIKPIDSIDFGSANIPWVSKESALPKIIDKEGTTIGSCGAIDRMRRELRCVASIGRGDCYSNRDIMIRSLGVKVIDYGAVIGNIGENGAVAD